MLKKVATYVILVLLVAVSIGPFLWLLSTALKSSDENIFRYPPVFWPQNPTFNNFVEVWHQVPMGAYFINSIVTTLMAVVLNLIFSVLAAYPLARFNFKGKNSVFLVVLATMMIPFQVIMIPLYLLVLKMNLVDSVSTLAAYIGVVIPFVVGGFGIFFVRQAMVNVPKQLEESAWMDGCNSFQILTEVIIPLIKPTLATLAVFNFMTSWGEFIWPSIVLTEPKLYTLPVGLVHLQGAFSANWRLIAAGTILSTIPVIVFFLILQRHFVSGTLAGSVKG